MTPGGRADRAPLRRGRHRRHDRPRDDLPRRRARARPAALTVEQLVRLIQEAGRIPVERDTLYNVVREHPRAALPEARAQGARPQGGASTSRCCRERARRGCASPPSATSTRGRSTRGSTASRRAPASRLDCALAERGRAARRGGRGRRRPHAGRGGGDHRRPAHRAGLRHRRARCGAQRRPRRRAADRGARGARRRPVVAHERRARAARCSALAARGREPRLVGLRAARGHRARGGTRGALVIGDPALEIEGRFPHVLDLGVGVAGAGPGCPSSSRRGAVARARSRADDERLLDAREATRASSAATPSPTSTRRARGLPAASLRAYLREAIRYDLGDDERRGLERFYDEAARAGLLPRARVRFFDEDRRRRCRAAVARHAPLARRRAASASAPPKASGSPTEASLFDLGLAADAVRRRKHPARRRHVHRRPQRQLHERLHDELPLLRLLPPAGAPRGVRALARGSSARSCRRSSTRAACRSSCRAACTRSCASSGTRTSSAG